MSEGAHVELAMGWDALGETQDLRRTTAGYSAIWDLAAAASPPRPLRVNAFFYEFLCPAKNFDLVLNEHVDGIGEPVRAIAARMADPEAFEREAAPIDPARCEVYLGLRHVAARREAAGLDATILVDHAQRLETIRIRAGIDAS